MKLLSMEILCLGLSFYPFTISLSIAKGMVVPAFKRPN